VGSEVALALVTLIGAGLFLKSFDNARKSNIGFDPQRVLLLGFSPSSSGYDVAQGKAFFRQLRQRVEALPGVESVSYADSVPLGFEGASSTDVQVEGYTPRTGENMDVYRTRIAPGYLQTMRIPLVAGRDFTERDDENSPAVAIVNEAFVQRYFHGQYAVGRHVNVGRMLTIAGVAGNSKFRQIAESPQPGLYLPFRQFYRIENQGILHIRTAGPPTSVLAAARREVRALDPNIAIFGATSLTDYIEASMLMHKVAASILSSMGLLALILAALGLYSVMAYSVMQRTHEIGIRLALGAQSRDVLRLVVGQGMLVSLAGVAVGLAAAFALTRLLARLLFGVKATDPVIFASAALFLAAIALAATYIPARRAMHVDPMASLREE
jgi:predicted permease